MTGLFTRLFESSEDRGKRMRAGAKEYDKKQKRKKKKKKSAAATNIKLAPVKREPGLGDTVSKIRKRNKYLKDL